MKQTDDYVAGPHHFWIHFWCGLVAGAVLGIYSFGQLFDRAWEVGLGAASIALVAAYCCGRWGDSAWERIIEFLFVP